MMKVAAASLPARLSTHVPLARGLDMHICSNTENTLLSLINPVHSGCKPSQIVHLVIWHV